MPHIAHLARRLALLIGRGWLRLTNDTPAIQQIQAEFFAGEVHDQMERVQDYGLTSVAHPGMQAISAFVNGDRSNSIVLAVADTRYRLRGLQTGEVALYDDQGQVVHLTRSGISISTPLSVTVSAGQSLRLEAEDIVLHGRTSLSWDVDGYGRRVTSTGGGSYEDKTWQQGAVVSPQTLPIHPPEGP